MSAIREFIAPTERILVDEADASMMMSVSIPTLRKWVAAGLLPRVEMPDGQRRNLYRVSDLSAFSDSLGNTNGVRAMKEALA